jgi:hypothetical protein
VSQHHRRIAVVDLCRPSDVYPDQLLAAAMRKQQAYLPLLEALSYYSEQGWTIHVFPWVVGIRGMIDPLHVQSLLKFAEIQQKYWKSAVEHTALASVRAFHFLHRVRFGGLSETARPDLDPDHEGSGSDNEEAGRHKCLPCSETTHCVDLNSSEADPGDAPHIPKRADWRLTSRAVNQATVRVVALPSSSNGTGGLTLSICPGPVGAARGKHRHAVARRTHFKKITTQARIIVRAKSLVAPALCAETPRPSGRQRPTQTCGERATTTRTSESNLDGTEPQPAERLQPATPELPLAVLWTRWRQVEPRHDGRTAAGATTRHHRSISKEKFLRGRERGRGQGDSGEQ